MRRLCFILCLQKLCNCLGSCVYKDKKFENASAWAFLFWFKSCNIWLQSKADAFEYADQVLERWYPTVEEGSNKGIVVLVTSQKEGAVTGGPAFVQAVGENILDATVTENLPGNLALICHPLSQNYSTIYATAFDFEKIMVVFICILTP
jgi:hypothetical protein